MDGEWRNGLEGLYIILYMYHHHTHSSRNTQMYKTIMARKHDSHLLYLTSLSTPPILQNPTKQRPPKENTGKPETVQ